jgi:hypothetical protein
VVVAGESWGAGLGPADYATIAYDVRPGG